MDIYAPATIAAEKTLQPALRLWTRSLITRWVSGTIVMPTERTTVTRPYQQGNCPNGHACFLRGDARVCIICDYVGHPLDDAATEPKLSIPASRRRYCQRGACIDLGMGMTAHAPH